MAQVDREHGLGRRRAPDPRDRNYLLPRRPLAAAITRRFWTAGAGYLDQGTTSQCVAYASKQWLMSSPVRNTLGITEEKLYKECQLVDEWPGEDYDGTSVRAAFKVLKNKNVVGDYYWAFDCARVVEHVLMVGPVVLGTDWYDGMFDVDKKGYIAPKENDVLAGGHAYILLGVDRERKNPDGSTGAGRIMNSWGKSWGQSGRAWMTFNVLDKLIKAQGEACNAHELKLNVPVVRRATEVEYA